MVVFVGVDVVVDENGVGVVEIVGVIGTNINAVSSFPPTMPKFSLTSIVKVKIKVSENCILSVDNIKPVSLAQLTEFPVSSVF